VTLRRPEPQRHPCSAPASHNELAPLRACVCRHWLFLLLLTGAAALRVLVTIAYWPALELFGDSYDYLAHTWVFQPGVWNPEGYPILLKMLSPLDSLAAVTILQHVFGLLLGVGIYLLLVRFRVRPWLAAVAAIPVLFDAYQLEIEQYILAETLTEVLLFLALLLLFWRRRVSLPRAAAIGALLVGAGITRSVALPILAVVGVYLLVRRYWREFCVYAAVGAVGIISYLGWYAMAYGYFGFPGFSGYFLYGRVASFATCSYPMPTKLARLCPLQPVQSRPYNVDYYVWMPGSPLQQPDLGSLYVRNSLAKQFAEEVILHQPLGYLRVVVLDTWHYFTPGRWTEPNGDVVDMRRWQFPGPHHNGKSGLLVNGELQPYETFFANEGYGLKRIRPSPTPALMGALRTYQAGAYTQGPVLLASLLGGVIVGFRRRSASRRGMRGQRSTRDLARDAALLLAITGFLLLIVPSMTTGFSYRFELPVLVVLPPAGALSGQFLLDWLKRYRARRGRPTEGRMVLPGRADQKPAQAAFLPHGEQLLLTEQREQLR
jgi:hypothetical protein